MEHLIDVNGQEPFEGDTFIPIEILKLKEKFSIQNVLETGSQYGSSLQWFDNNFDISIGCEPNKDFWNIAGTKARVVKNLNSIDFLKEFKSSASEYPNTLFYIDSHWHDTPCPLKDELELISTFKINPIIVIHDFKVPNSTTLGFDVYDYELKFEEIESLLNKIYSKGFDYHYNSDEESNGAKRGIIYIYPKV